MILSASRRTDIPAFYSDWFFNRIRQGYVMVRNPINKIQVSKIPINRHCVDCIVFWTKNPENILTRLNLLDNLGYNYYFQFTLNPYSKNLEKNVPYKKHLIEIFIKLSEQIGKHKVIWRYDPIILTDNLSVNYHIQYFDYLASQLKHHTDKCIISFLQLYQKTKVNLKHINLININNNTKKEVVKLLLDIARQNGLQLEICSDSLDLSYLGVLKSKCIDDRLISKISECEVKIPNDNNQRQYCGCVSSIDIGTYNTCQHCCLYCYANLNQKSVFENIKNHNPNYPLLCGTIGMSDKIYERKVKKYINPQITLFKFKI